MLVQVAGRLLGSWRSVAVALTLSAVTSIVVAVGIYLVHASWPFTPDSASYVEMARGIRTGMGAVSRPWGGCEEWMLNPLFPPGFPALLAAVSEVTGLSEEVQAPYLMVVLGAVLPVLVWWALKPLIGRGWACLASVLVGFSASAVWSATHVLSDMPFLLLVVLSFGLFARAVIGSGGMALWVMAGVIAGTSLWLRNAGVAVVAAYGVVALLGIASARRDRRVARGVVLALASASLAAATFYARNVLVFGDPQPYDMPSGAGDFARNARVLAQEVIADLAGFRAARLVVWDAMLAIPVAGLALWLAVRLVARWREAETGIRIVIAWLVAYALLGGVMLVVASSIYRWGEPINARHVMQYSWALWGIVFWVIARAISGARSWFRGAGISLAVVAGVLVGARGITIAETWRDVAALRALPWDALAEEGRSGISGALVWAEKWRRVAQDVAGVRLPANAFVYAEHPYPVRIAMGVDARKMTGGCVTIGCNRPYYVVQLKGMDPRPASGMVSDTVLVYEGSLVTIWHVNKPAALAKDPPFGGGST